MPTPTKSLEKGMSTTAFVPIQIQANISLEEWRQFQEWRSEKQRHHREEIQKQRDAEEAAVTDEVVVVERIQRGDDRQEVEEGDKKRKRRSFGREYKLEAISFLENGTMQSTGDGETPVSVRHCAKKYGVEPKNIRDWRRQVQKIRASDVGAKCIGSGRKPDWPEMEQQLHNRFTEWRSSGRRVDHHWFFRNGKEIFEERYPEHVTIAPDGQKKYTLKWSRGWFDGFKRRKGIVFKATNKKRTRKHDEDDDDDDDDDGDDGDNEGEYIQIHVDGLAGEPLFSLTV